MDKQPLSHSLSAEMCAVAAALHAIRSQLYRMVENGSWPQGAFRDMATVLTDGLYVARRLQRLASDSVGKVDDEVMEMTLQPPTGPTDDVLLF